MPPVKSPLMLGIIWQAVPALPCCALRVRSMGENHRERANQEEGPAAGVIDGTIWKRSEPGSLMSLRIDEDKMGSGSRGNNLWDFTLLSYGLCPKSVRLWWTASPPSSVTPLCSCNEKKEEHLGRLKEKMVKAGVKGLSQICLHDFSINLEQQRSK